MNGGCLLYTSPNFDRNKALEQQIELLTMKKEHLENLISFARGIKAVSYTHLDVYKRQSLCRLSAQTRNNSKT